MAVREAADAVADTPLYNTATGDAVPIERVGRCRFRVGHGSAQEVVSAGELRRRLACGEYYAGSVRAHERAWGALDRLVAGDGGDGA